MYTLWKTVKARNNLYFLLLTFTNLQVQIEPETEPRKFNSILSILSYLLKAPLVPSGTPVVNALFKQRACIENVLKACIGLQPGNHMLLEHKIGASLQQVRFTSVFGITCNYHVIIFSQYYTISDLYYDILSNTMSYYPIFIVQNAFDEIVIDNIWFLATIR